MSQMFGTFSLNNSTCRLHLATSIMYYLLYLWLTVVKIEGAKLDLKYVNFVTCQPPQDNGFLLVNTDQVVNY